MESAKEMLRLTKESDILRVCCQYLQDRGYFFWRINNIPVHGRARSKFQPLGLPDIMMLDDGRFFGIEVKRPKGAEDQREPNGRRIRERKLSPSQSEWAIKCVYHDGNFAVIHSFDELIDELCEWGIIR